MLSAARRRACFIWLGGDDGLTPRGPPTQYEAPFFYLAMATNAAAGSGYLTLAMIFSSSAASVLS